MAPTLRCALGVPHRNVRQERATNEQSSVFHGSFTGDRIINALHICRAQCLEMSHLCLMIAMTVWITCTLSRNKRRVHCRVSTH